MYRPLLLLALFLTPTLAAQTQWQYTGPGLFYPVGVAENDDYVFFAASRGSGASADGGYVYRSADGGRTWENTSTGLVTAQKALGPSLTAIGAADGLVVVAARQAYNKAHLYFSTDNGASWTLKTNFPDVYEGGIRALHVLDASTLVAYANMPSGQARVFLPPTRARRGRYSPRCSARWAAPSP